MVDTIEGAVDLVTTICRLGGAGDFIQATNALAAERGLVEAVASRDTPALYGWLMESFSFQGISDRIAWSYIEDHGNASWYVVEAGLEATRCQCPKLGSFDAYTGCRYRKIPRTCAEPTFMDLCPVPTLPLRKGDLNQLAYSLYYFLRDRCDGDLVGFIDRLFALAVAEGPADPIAAKRAALIAEISKVFAVSQKLIAMTFSVLLMGGRPSRPDWIAVGRSLIAVDTLVHNFLHRTGILAAYGCNHPYGDRCYGKAGCATVSSVAVLGNGTDKVPVDCFVAGVHQWNPVDLVGRREEDRSSTRVRLGQARRLVHHVVVVCQHFLRCARLVLA
jgi:hypothetical protein